MTITRRTDAGAVLAAALAALVCMPLFVLHAPTRTNRLALAALLRPVRGALASNRLSSRRSVRARTARVSRRRAYVLLARSSPRVKLYPGAKGLEPGAVELRGRRNLGWSFVHAIRLARPYGRGPPSA